MGSITAGVTPGRAARANRRVRWVLQGFRPGPQSGSRNRLRPHAEQISPNKNMSYRCTTAAFTLSPVPGGFRHLVLTHPETERSMRFLSVGSHLCTQASFRQPLAVLPLPSASGYPTVMMSSHRGLAPHKLMPMSGVHHAIERTLGNHPRAINVHRSRLSLQSLGVSPYGGTAASSSL